MSTLSAFPFIGEQSFATPGAFNSPLSIISANIAAINTDVGAISGVTISPPSGNTIQMPSDLSISGYLSVGKGVSIGTQAPSIAEPVALTIGVNSGISDYLYFNDTSNLRSDYLIGSHAGGTADGLNIFDVSGNTMIASFSKQSIRFYQQVVGPVFDSGGQVFNVINFGAVGNGINDDTAAIQTAITVAGGSGGIVFFPAGVYSLTTSLLIQNPAITLLGSGWLSQLSASTLVAQLVDVQAREATIQNLRFSGSSSNAANTVGNCIRLAAVGTNSDLLRVEGCLFDYFGRFGIVKPSSGATPFGLRILNNSFRSASGMGVDLANEHADIYLDSLESSQVIGNLCTSRNGYGISCFNAQGLLIEHNVIVNKSLQSTTGANGNASGYGISVYDNASQTEHCTIIGNSVASCDGIGIYVQGPHLSSVMGNVVKNVCQQQTTASSLLVAGITVINAHGVSVTGNTVSETSAPNGGIAIGTPTLGARLAGGAVTGNSIISCSDGIWLSAASGVVVLGNSISQISAGRGIRSDDTSYNCTIIGNRISVTSAQAMLLLGMDNCIVSQNVMELAGRGGIMIDVTHSALRSLIQGNTIRNCNMQNDAGNGYGIRGVFGRSVVRDNIVIHSSASSYIGGIQLRSTSSANLVVGNTFAGIAASGLTYDDAQTAPLSYDVWAPSAATDGTALLPAMAFYSEQSLGWYRSGASTLALSYGTVLLGTKAGINTLVPDKTLHVSLDHASTPGIKVGTGTDAQGWYTFIGNDAAGSTFGFVGNAFNDNAAEFDIRVKGTGAASNKLRILGSGQLLAAAIGSAVAPTWAFSSETSLGLYSSGASTLAASYGTFNLATNAVRLSMRTIAGSAVTATAANTNVAVNEVVFTVTLASGASLCINSGGTTWIFNSAISVKNT